MLLTFPFAERLAKATGGISSILRGSGKDVRKPVDFRGDMRNQVPIQIEI